MDKKALIIRFSSLGDVVLTSCLFQPLIDRSYKPYLLTHPPYGEIFKDDPRVEVIELRKDELFKNLERLKGFDLYLDMHKNLKTLLLKLILGGTWKSYSKESIRRRLAIKFKAFRTPYSVVDSYLRAIGEKGYRPSIVLSEDRLNRLKQTYGEGFVAISSGARYKKKRYPYFVKVAEKLRKKGIRVVFVGAQGECDGVEDAENLCGKLSLIDTAGIIKLAKIFVGNDSGLLHIARAVKTKAVQIYGGTHPTLGFSLFPEEGKVIIKNLPCQPCTLHGKGECKYKTYECLEIPPEIVVDEILKLTSQEGH
ncbi:glycosyltransferase family 9 protein [Thermocrinis sp.]|uniref:glycosyltransferase family 9 protein n=1 Tax=Thermocrinis sp. TaxID=2024383 RepID=UPI002FDED6F9